MTQNERIVRHLLEFGSITPLDALAEYGIMRLAARISDVKALGFDIDTEMVTGTNRFGEKTTFAKYSLRGEHHG